MDFEKQSMLFSMQEPYYGMLLSAMERKPIRDPRMQTLGVSRSGNVFKLAYNPDFVENLNTDTVLELLKHECLHVAFNHFTIWDDPEGYRPPEDIWKLRNIAEDLEINGYLNRSKIQKEAGGVFAEDFGWDNYLGVREYYRLLTDLLNNQKQKAVAKKVAVPCNGGQGGQTGQNQQSQSGQSGNNNSQSGSPNQQNSNQNQNNQNNQNQQQNNTPNQETVEQAQQAVQQVEQEFFDQHQGFDDHSLWPTDMTQSEQETISQMIDDMLLFAAEEVEKAHGTIPGEMVGKIEKLRKKPRPVTDWKRYFRRYLGNEFTELIRKSKKRESHRFPDAAGNRHQRKSHILVAIDTSGSVSMPEYMEFFGQIKTLQDRATFHVVECDTRIAHEYDFRNKPSETLHGGGGTDFQPPVDLFLANRRKYDALVYFTDGYADIPKNTPKETLWVISSNGNHDKSRYKVNGASAVFIKSKDNQ